MFSTSFCSRLLTGLGLCIALLAPAAWAAPCVKTLRWVDAPPYGFKDANGDVRGLHIDLATQALKRVGCEVQLVEMPWVRAITALKLGRLDMLAGAADTQERKAFAFFSGPTNSTRSLLFTSVSAQTRYKPNTLADIIGTDFRLGVQRESKYSTAYEVLLDNPAFTKRLTYVYSQESALRMLSAGRIDGVVGEELSSLNSIQKLGLGDSVKPTQLVISDNQDYFAFSKASNSAAFVKRFDAALRAMVKDGSYQRILERYLNCPVRMDRLGCQ